MSESVKRRFDPQITERDRRLPVWVTPRIQTSDPAGALAAGSVPVVVANDGHAFTLNASGQAIHALCQERRSIFEVVDALRERYLADDDKLYVDVTSAVLTLRRFGLIGWSVLDPGARSPVRFVVGVEDKTYFRWQLPILFESLTGQLPEGWDVLVVVCNNHAPLSEAMRHIFETYGITYFTGIDHPANENMDFAGGGDTYAPINRIEALRVVAPHVQDDDVLFLLDTDNFLYRELDPSIFPRSNALRANRLIGHDPFFGHKPGVTGIDLRKLLEALGCRSRFEPGGVAVFLMGRTVKNGKFVQDCFRFTQTVYLLGRIAGLAGTDTWVSEMPSFALSLTANGIPYEVIDSPWFTVDKARSVPAGTFYHYYADLKDTSIDGAFYDSEWHKQRLPRAGQGHPARVRSDGGSGAGARPRWAARGGAGTLCSNDGDGAAPQLVRGSQRVRRGTRLDRGAVRRRGRRSGARRGGPRRRGLARGQAQDGGRPRLDWPAGRG